MKFAGAANAEAIQRKYYERTAHMYDAAQVTEADEHFLALKYISAFCDILNVASALDVGCGTGRGLKYFLDHKPDVDIRGIEPVPTLIGQAVRANGIPPDLISVGSGDHLPFPDDSIDAVFECGVLHHARNPRQVVREMLRVSRRAVFLSDENRFAHGSLFSRCAKVVLCKTGAFGAAYRLKTLGKGFRFSEGDGLAYSYSVFDCIDLLARWADRIVLIPTDNTRTSGFFHPLLTSFHLLLCAVRDTETRDTE
jgi:ubiquinone/menaquinone biosynthesis C-methylase UbiE